MAPCVLLYKLSLCFFTGSKMTVCLVHGYCTPLMYNCMCRMASEPNSSQTCHLVDLRARVDTSGLQRWRLCVLVIPAKHSATIHRNFLACGLGPQCTLWVRYHATSDRQDSSCRRTSDVRSSHVSLVGTFSRAYSRLSVPISWPESDQT